MSSETNGAVVPVPRKSITVAMAERFNMEPAAFEATVRATCFPANPPATKEEFAAGMLIAHKLELNPITKEIHFARAKGGGIHALVGVDGWYVMANRHPQYDGAEFEDIVDPKSGKVVAIKCRIYRRDRTRPTEVTEYLAECQRGSEAWKLTPTRMLRHRAFGQCARIAFSFAGVLDYDEFERWQESERGTQQVSVIPTVTVPLPPPLPPVPPEVPVEQHVEPLPENYMSHLEESFIAVKSGDIDSLNEIWIQHESVAHLLTPDDQARAIKLYQEHEGRMQL